jgi:hypothetical protein
MGFVVSPSVRSPAPSSRRSNGSRPRAHPLLPWKRKPSAHRIARTGPPGIKRAPGHQVAMSRNRCSIAWHASHGPEAIAISIAAAIRMSIPEREFAVASVSEMSGPTIGVAFFFGEIDPRIIPRVAVSGVAGFHGYEGGFGCVRRGVLEEGAGGGGLVLSADEGSKRGDAAGFAQLFEEGTAFGGVVSKGRTGGGVGGERCRGVLEELGVEKGQRFLEGVGFGAWDGAFDGGGIETAGYEAGDEEVDSVFEAASIVARVRKDEAVIVQRGCCGSGGGFFRWRLR